MPKPDTKDSPEDLVFAIAALEYRAHALGHTLTGHALNRAKNVLGWTMAGDDNKAALALRGEH